MLTVIRALLIALVSLAVGQLTFAAGVSGQGTWETTLEARDLNDDGQADAYYDSELDVTWLADANLAQTTRFDADGRLNRANETGFLLGMMNGWQYLGVSTWRLPRVPGSSACAPFTNRGGTNCGYNVDTDRGELAHLFYETLGNKAEYDTSGNPGQPGAGLTNTGPFQNMQATRYWYGTAETSAADPDFARSFFFHFLDGKQYRQDDNLRFQLMLLTDGDVGERLALEPRDLNGDGAIDAYYDTVLDISWLANADIVMTTGWDRSGWPDSADSVVDFLRGTHYLGVDDWRLPSQSNPNQGDTGGELEHLYTITLGNTPVSRGGSLSDAGPFSNVGRNCYLYSGDTTYSMRSQAQQSFPSYPFGELPCGYQLWENDDNGLEYPKVWPVADGDVGQRATEVTLPPAYKLDVLVEGFSRLSRLEVHAINDAGEIVGCLRDRSGVPRAFVYTNDQLQEFVDVNSGAIGASCAYDINDAGTIVGALEASDRPYGGLYNAGFLYRNGELELLELPPGSPNGAGVRIASASQVNAAGDITVSLRGLADPVGLLNAAGTLEFGGAGGDNRGSFPTALSESGDWLYFTDYGPGDFVTYFGTTAVVDGQPRPFTDGIYLADEPSTVTRKYTWNGLSDEIGAFGGYSNYDCGGGICAPYENFGLLRSKDGIETRVAGTQSIDGLNEAGAMAGLLSRRPIYKAAADKPTFFLDELTDFAGLRVVEIAGINNLGEIALSLYDSTDDTYALAILRPVATQTLTMDIAPASGINMIDTSAIPSQPVEVAVYSRLAGGGEPAFDVFSIDPASITFGPEFATSLLPAEYRDVNGDGATDAVFVFDSADSGISCRHTTAMLHGRTVSDQAFIAIDTVHPIGCPITALTLDTNVFAFDATEGEFFKFTVKLLQPVEEAIEFEYMTTDGIFSAGNAVAPDDYVAASGRLWFWPGMTEGAIWVKTNTDEVVEQNESMQLVITSARKARIILGTARGRIFDNTQP